MLLDWKSHPEPPRRVVAPAAHMTSRIFPARLSGDACDLGPIAAPHFTGMSAQLQRSVPDTATASHRCVIVSEPGPDGPQ